MTDHITIPRALLEQALDATERAVSDGKTYISECRSAASALRAALAAPASKPLFAELIAQHEGLAEELAAMDAPPAWHDAPEVAALKSEIERLRKDAERLDYIEESGNFGVTRYRSGPGGPVLIEAEDGKKDISKSASSLRDAIDSVIKEAK